MMCKFNKYIKKILSNKYLKFILCVIFFYAFIILLHPDVLKVSYLHAEDGKHFFGAWVSDGFKSLFFTQGGYLCFVSRIIGGLTFLLFNITNSVYIIGNTIETLSTLFTATVFAWFCSEEFDFFIKKRYKRIFYSVILITLFSVHYSVLYNAVGIHWICGFVTFLASIKLLNNQLPCYKFLPLILVSIVSSASSMILGFALLYYLLKNVNIKDIKGSLKKHSKHDYIKFVLMGLFMCVQAYFILFVGEKTVGGISNSLTDILFYTLNMFLSLPLSIFGPIAFNIISELGLNVYLGSTLWIILIIFVMKTGKTKMLLLCAIDIFFLYFMTLYKNTDLLTTYQGLISFTISFYNSLPSMIYLMMVILVFDEFKIKKSFDYAVCFIAIFLIVFYMYKNNSYQPDFNKNANFDKISKFVESKSRYYTNVEITPYNGWCVKIPVNKKYCEENVCEKRNVY